MSYNEDEKVLDGIDSNTLVAGLETFGGTSRVLEVLCDATNLLVENNKQEVIEVSIDFCDDPLFKNPENLLEDHLVQLGDDYQAYANEETGVYKSHNGEVERDFKSAEELREDIEHHFSTKKGR
ncbi:MULTISPECIES: hypothetical protein [Klebsiella]|uniref:Uncharacterized protein n=2 Tax=Klebsiella pneumoniae complex TaxID=3390273 RepID=A0A486R5G5_KLEPN|nr:MULTISPECIES: hypothetical protein [Klebsiella]EFE5034587.1 hypothetical protein [Escherichia coli]HAT1662622.1 hypothetical protein [Raoultella ornithinolytica]AZZ20038.1 hypothetical protein CE636_20415 [Klebsiella sp. LY]EKV3652048.1 hypothetical protein [Klebsiella quasipneumoniae]EKW1737115.1 hypothetical protein [Klebsiella pneumoniae]